MDFILAKGDNIDILVFEDSLRKEYYTMVMRRYQWFIQEWRPPLRYFAGMKITLLNDREAMKILKEHTEDSSRGALVAKIIERYEELPF